MTKLKFYKIPKEYLDYLRKFDNQVPQTENQKNVKFYCGIVLNINDYNYFAPVSSFKTQQQTNLLIMDRARIISSIRFSFMVPVPDFLLEKLQFKELSDDYRGLVTKEHTYCESNFENIKNKADKVYKMGTNPSHYQYKNCCKFKLLEEKHDEYTAMVKEAMAPTVKEASVSSEQGETYDGQA